MVFSFGCDQHIRAEMAVAGVVLHNKKAAGLRSCVRQKISIRLHPIRKLHFDQEPAEPPLRHTQLFRSGADVCAVAGGYESIHIFGFREGLFQFRRQALPFLMITVSDRFLIIE